MVLFKQNHVSSPFDLHNRERLADERSRWRAAGPGGPLAEPRTVPVFAFLDFLRDWQLCTPSSTARTHFFRPSESPPSECRKASKWSIAQSIAAMRTRAHPGGTKFTSMALP